jgi:hypothetical protein
MTRKLLSGEMIEAVSTVSLEPNARAVLAGAGGRISETLGYWAGPVGLRETKRSVSIRSRITYDGFRIWGGAHRRWAPQSISETEPALSPKAPIDSSTSFHNAGDLATANWRRILIPTLRHLRKPMVRALG